MEKENKGDGTVTITLHGLAEDNGLVRADAFLDKFRALMNSIKIADASLNGKKTHNIVITDLKSASATAALREKVSVKHQSPAFWSPLVGEALNAVYNGDRNLGRFPVELIESFRSLTKIEKFSHGEIDFGNSNVIRIDDYLSKQAEKAFDRLSGNERADPNFQGISYGVFDGVIKEIDSRGALVRGRLILTAGGKEIECLFRREDIPALRANFEKRARVDAVAHYDGELLLPVRLDVRRITPVIEAADLGRWRGALAARRVRRPERL